MSSLISGKAIPLANLIAIGPSKCSANFIDSFNSLIPDGAIIVILGIADRNDISKMP